MLSGGASRTRRHGFPHSDSTAFLALYWNVRSPRPAWEESTGGVLLERAWSTAADATAERTAEQIMVVPHENQFAWPLLEHFEPR
jgi:hypothetical protein